MFFDRQKGHTNGILTLSRQVETQLGTFPSEELVRDLYQYSRAVSGFGITSASPAMRQIDEYLYSLADDLMTLFAAEARHESDSARVMLIRWIV
jgi:hypothetical protein